MRAVIQRVNRASVSIAGAEVSAIGAGALVLPGIANDDTPEDAEWPVVKIPKSLHFLIFLGILFTFVLCNQ